MVTAGLAEVAAGSIAMGLGGFLAARGDAGHCHSELRREEREEREIAEAPEREAQEVVDLFKDYGGSCKTYTVTDARRHRAEE